MSTGLLSPSYFNVDDVFALNNANNLLQQQQRKAVGTPMTFNNQDFGTAMSAFSSHQQQQPQHHAQLHRTASAQPSCAFQPVEDKFGLNKGLLAPMSGSTSTLISNEVHKKLDRAMSEPGDRNQAKASQANSSRYKTELCRPFEENGTCKYGDKCQFAHGMHELRSLSRHPKYKTELCRTFHTIGFCPYGPRCHFIHNPEEKRSPPPTPTTPTPSMQYGNQPISRPTERPKSLSNTMRAFSLGSVADSPTSSLSTSPVSPTFFDQDDQYSVFSPATFNLNNVFTFPQTDSLLSPGRNTSTSAFTATTTTNNRSMYDGNRNQRFQPRNTDDVYHELLMDAPASPVSSSTNSDRDSPIESPLDVSRGLRLPIFSRLSINDDL